MHLKPADTLDGNMQTNLVIEKGRKHYSFEPTPIYSYKPGLKIGFAKNVSSEELVFRER
jgi:hypothetical protein